MTAHALDLYMANHFGPGDRVDLILELPRDLTAEDLDKVQAELKGQGLELTAPIEIGSDTQWPNALRIQFRRPHRPAGTAVLPLVVLIIGALGAVGIAGLLGWRISDVIAQVGNYILPITAMAIGGLLLWAWISKSPVRRGGYG